MKKYSFILWAALSMTSVFTACTNEDSLVTEQNESKTVTIRATIDGDLGSRVALTDDAENRVVKVDWAEGDAFKIKVNGTNYTFVYDTSTGEFAYDNQNGEFPATFESAGTVTATYPATTPTAYTNQPGTLDGAAALLVMEAKLSVTAGESTGNLNLNFTHKNSIVKMILSNDDFKGKEVTGVTLKSGSTAVATASGDFTGDAENGSIVAYFAVKPKAMTNISIVAVCEGNCYAETLSDKTLETGKLYNVSKAMTKVTGDVAAANAKKGDFALLNGTFISKDATLTDVQKACVSGIVFWTENEDNGSSTLVGTGVADKIMQTDFQDCTHGLIVSLTNVSSSCVWQGKMLQSGQQQNYESIYDTFQNTDNFNTENKTNYVAIESGIGASDNINKILGYNNTKVLEAYNGYCKENDRSDYLVKPIEALATWKASNPGIANTTGWFLPSAKELHMLCYKDVADVGNTKDQTYIDTRDAVNTSLEMVNGTKLSGSYYWSSSEYATSDAYAIFVLFSNAEVNNNYKSSGSYVRAVCTF